MAWSFELGVPGGAITAAVLAVALTLVVAIGTIEARHEIDRRRRLVLIALRVVSAVLVFLVVSQPRWLGTKVERAEGRVSVLLDASRSMQVEDGAPRIERLKKLAARWADEDGSERAFAYTFGERLEPVALEDVSTELSAQQNDTHLGKAIDTLLEEDTSGDLGAVVVVTDGAYSDLSPGSLKGRGVRVHSVLVGGDSGLRDDAIAEVRADPVAFLRQRAEVRVRIRSLGGEGGTMVVSLRHGDEVVRETSVALSSTGEGEAVLRFTPRGLGREVYRVTIPVAPGDAVPENNERAFLVRVTRDKLRVLLVAGQPSWDERFLRAFLKRDPTIDLISFFILRTASDLTMAAPDELALIPFPTDELFREHLGSFDVVIFQDFEFGPYQMAGHLPRIRDYVERGGAFVMVGGELSFGSGGYAETPIAEIVPVRMMPAGTPETRSLYSGRFQPKLSPSYELHPLVSLVPGSQANREAWDRLSPLEGGNAVLGTKEDAQVLLVHPDLVAADGQAMPILSVMTAGKGRTMAITADTTWRWGMASGGATGDSLAYDRFWDRVLRWLSYDPSLDPAQITTDRERYGPRASAIVHGWLRSEAYEPLADREIRVTLRSDSQVALREIKVRTDADGRFRTEIAAPASPGAYEVSARAADETEPRAREVFIVEAGGDELADPRAQSEMLRVLSEATDGTFYASPEAAPSLSAFDASRMRSLGTTERAPFSTILAFLFLAIVLLGEWVTRRAYGYR